MGERMCVWVVVRFVCVYVCVCEIDCVSVWCMNVWMNEVLNEVECWCVKWMWWVDIWLMMCTKSWKRLDRGCMGRCIRCVNGWMDGWWCWRRWGWRWRRRVCCWWCCERWVCCKCWVRVRISCDCFASSTWRKTVRWCCIWCLNFWIKIWSNIWIWLDVGWWICCWWVWCKIICISCVWGARICISTGWCIGIWNCRICWWIRWRICLRLWI